MQQVKESANSQIHGQNLVWAHVSQDSHFGRSIRFDVIDYYAKRIRVFGLISARFMAIIYSFSVRITGNTAYAR